MNNKTLKVLRDWKEPAVDMQNFAIRHFSVFTPKSADPVLGDAYRITPFGVQSESDFEYLRYAGSSSNR